MQLTAELPAGTAISPRPVYPTAADSNPHIAPGPSHYVSLTSDKNRKMAIVLCLLGLLGIAGLHRLYVGKIITGIIYMLFMWLWFFANRNSGSGTEVFMIIAFVPNIIDLVQLLMGQFTDNVGQPLRK